MNSLQMGRIAHGTGVSRDYAIGMIPCRMTKCPVNQCYFCTMASAITINAAGQCERGLDFTAKPAVQASRKCALCGGRIRWNGQAWQHQDEQLSHEAIPL